MPFTPPSNLADRYPEDDRTPLMVAACENDLCSMFEYLLEGADMDAETAQGWTALTYAASLGHYQIVEQLLDAGADPNKKKSYDLVDTPLSLAAWKGDFDLVRLLIRHGADPHCYAGLRAARAEYYARDGNHHEISEFLKNQEEKKKD